MITKPFACVLAGLLALGVAMPAVADEASCVHFSDGWVRLPAMAGMPMAAGFGHLHNACGEEVVVVAARSDAFADVSVHETTVVDGVNRMREVEHLPLAAGQGAELRPGGLHLMLMQGKAPLQEGQRLPLVLELADGREVRGELLVRKP